MRQSVPILGYLSVAVLFFVPLFPGSALGPELAAVFAVFTSQAWNMAFSFYQSPRMVRADAEATLRAAIDWGCFGELCSYDDRTRSFSLDHRQP